MFDSILKAALDRVSVLDLVEREEAVRILKAATVDAVAEAGRTFLAGVDKGDWGMVDGLVHQVTDAGRSLIDQWRTKALAA